MVGRGDGAPPIILSTGAEHYLGYATDWLREYGMTTTTTLIFECVHVGVFLIV